MLEVTLVKYAVIFCIIMGFLFTFYTMICVNETFQTIERMESRQLFIGQSSYWTPEDCIYHDDED